MKRTLVVIGLAAAGLGTAIGADDAAASGFALRDNSAAGVGRIYAGNGSLADDLATIFNNPAGMTRLSGNQAEASGTVIYPTIDFNGSGTTAFAGNAGLGIAPGIAPTSGGSDAKGGRLAIVPSLYGLIDLSPDLKAGLAVTAPFGLTTKYTSTWVGRYLGIKSAVMSIDINPNIAYRVNDWLSVGAGVSAQYFSFDFTNAVNQSALAGAPPNSVFPDATARFKGDDWGFGYNLGVLLEPVKGTRVGLTYRSAIDHTVKGDLSFQNASPVLVGSSPLAAAALAASGAKAGVDLPGTVGLSLTHAVTPTLTLLSDVQWTNWSRFKQVDVVRTTTGAVASATPQNFRNTWMVSLGAEYRPDENWTLRGGVGWDQSPVTDAFRTVRLPDRDRYMLGIGFGYKFSDALSADFAYAHYFGGKASITNSVNNTDGLGTTVTGDFDVHVDMLAASVRFRF